MENENINISFNFEDSEEKKQPSKTSKRRTTELYELSTKYLYKRAFSESSLLDAVGIDELKKGYSYNFITGGDVDALSFLKLILRHQNLDYLLFSTWCMAGEDIMQIGEWVKDRKIKKMDAYVGEIFPNSYRIEYSMLLDLFNKYKCGRIAHFKNHSKIFAGTGDKFSFGIQSSANINTNPRTENACITIDDGIYKFYRDYFDNIESYK